MEEGGGEREGRGRERREGEEGKNAVKCCTMLDILVHDGTGGGMSAGMAIWLYDCMAVWDWCWDVCRYGCMAV